MQSNEKLEIARRLAEEGDYERASTIVYREIKRNPNSYEWLTVMTYILLATEKANRLGSSWFDSTSGFVATSTPSVWS